MRVRTMLFSPRDSEILINFPFHSVPFQVKVESSSTFPKLSKMNKKLANHSPEFQLIFYFCKPDEQFTKQPSQAEKYKAICRHYFSV